MISPETRDVLRIPFGFMFISTIEVAIEEVKNDTGMDVGYEIEDGQYAVLQVDNNYPNCTYKEIAAQVKKND